MAIDDIVRPARKEDTKGIAKCIFESRQYPGITQEEIQVAFAEFFANEKDHIYLVAEKADEIVGYIAGTMASNLKGLPLSKGLVKDPDTAFYLTDYKVWKGHKKIEDLLLSRLISYAKRSGAKLFFTIALNEDTHSLAIYRRHNLLEERYEHVTVFRKYFKQSKPLISQYAFSA